MIDAVKDIDAMVVLPTSRDELRRILWIPEPCTDGDTDILNIHFAVMELLTEDPELSPIFKNILTIEVKLKVLNSASCVWVDLPTESQVNIPEKTCVKVILTSPDPIGPIRSLPPLGGGVKRDPRKKPNIDVGLLNKRDPRRKNVTTEATRQQASFQQGVYDMSKPAYAAQLLANQVANLKSIVPQPVPAPLPFQDPTRNLNKRDPRKKRIDPVPANTLPEINTIMQLPSLRPVTQPQILPESKPKDPRLQKQPASKQGSRMDPRLRKQQQPPLVVRAKDVENTAELMNDIIKNKSNLSVLVKPSERLSLESLDDVDEVADLIDALPDDLYEIPEPETDQPPLPVEPDKAPTPPPAPSDEPKEPLPSPLSTPKPDQKTPNFNKPKTDTVIDDKISTKEDLAAKVDDNEDQHDDSDSEGELHIDMGSQEAKRRASGDHEAIRTEKDNIRTEDLLEEMYGGFEDKEDSDNSQSSDGKILASTQGDNTNDGDDTPEILLSPDGDLYVEIPSDDNDEAEETPPIVVRKEVKTSEQLKAEQEMLANLEKERDRLNAIVEEVDKEPDNQDNELEEGELTDTDSEEEEVIVCDDESPLSPEANPQEVVVEDVPEEIPLDRVETEGEASDSEVEIEVEEEQKEFRKYWEDFEEETGSNKDARANKETGWDGKNPLFKRRQEMNSPLTKHGDLEPELSKCQDIPAKQDDSCVFFKRRQSMAVTNELPDPPPPLINPALAANKTEIAKTAASKLREMTAGFTSSYSTISMSSLSSNDSELTKPEPQSAIDRLRNHGTKSDRSSVDSANTDKTKSVYEHLAVDLEHATTPPPPDNTDKYNNDGNKSDYGQPVFTSDHINSGFSAEKGSTLRGFDRILEKDFGFASGQGHSNNLHAEDLDQYNINMMANFQNMGQNLPQSGGSKRKSILGQPPLRKDGPASWLTEKLQQRRKSNEEVGGNMPANPSQDLKFTIRAVHQNRKRSSASPGLFNNTVSASVIRQIDENIHLLQQNLPTGFVNPGEFLCSICKVKCNSEDTYKTHMTGKKHMKRLREIPPELREQHTTEVPSSSSPGASKRPREPSSDLFCNICDVQSSSLIEFRLHVAGKRHIKALKKLATNPEQEQSDAEHGIVQIEFDEVPVKTKDGIGFVNSHLTGQSSTSKIPAEPVPTRPNIRIIASKSSLLNNIPNCYGKPLTEVKVMDQFVPVRCKPCKSMYTIVSYKHQDTEIPQDYLDIEKERADKEKYKYNCRVCDIPVPDEDSLIKHIRSRQHAMKLNKPELAQVKDDDEIVIVEGCDNERGKAREMACRGFYPEYEEEISFSKGNTQKVYNFGYYIPLKKHTKAQKRKENRQRGRGGAHSINSQQRNTQIFPADQLLENDIRHMAARLAKEKIDQLQSENSNSKGKDTEKEIVQDVIDLSSDDDLDIIIESEKEKVDKSESDRNDHMEIEKKDKNDVCKDSIEDILIDDDSSSRHGSSRYDSSFYSDDDSSNFDDVESHPELRLLKNSALGSLWSYEGKVGPLICPEMAENMDMIFKRIQGAPDPRNKFRKSKSKDLEIAFDIYKSSSNYKKSINMAPDYRVVLVDPRDPVPDNSQVAKLEQLYLDRVPVLFAIVDRGTVSFITMASLTLPTFYDDQH